MIYIVQKANADDQGVHQEIVCVTESPVDARQYTAEHADRGVQFVLTSWERDPDQVGLYHKTAESYR